MMVHLSAMQLDVYGHLRFTIEMDGVTHRTTDEALEAAKALSPSSASNGRCEGSSSSGRGASWRSTRLKRATGDSMPRYFSVADGPDQLIDDTEGVNFPSLEAARASSLDLARDIVRDSGLAWEDWTFQIKDAAGQTLLVVPFSDAVVKH
jgi:hypothetical protein